MDDALKVMTQFWQRAAEVPDWSGADGWEPLMALMHPNIRIVEPPTLPYGGERFGPESYRDLLNEIDACWEIVGSFNRDSFPSGDKVMYRTFGRARARNTGKYFNLDVVTQWTVQNGLVTEVLHFYFDPNQVIAALDPRGCS